MSMEPTAPESDFGEAESGCVTLVDGTSLRSIRNAREVRAQVEKPCDVRTLPHDLSCDLEELSYEEIAE